MNRLSGRHLDERLAEPCSQVGDACSRGLAQGWELARSSWSPEFLHLKKHDPASAG